MKTATWKRSGRTRPIERLCEETSMATLSTCASRMRASVRCRSVDSGVVSDEIFEDNVKAWSGDHCMNPPDVPGIFFSNRKIDADKVNIMDIGPTVLDLFGVRVPAYCDGKALMPEKKK